MIHNDHLGTPQKMTDASGTVVWAADYKPFGEATITVSTITNNLRFPGQYYDAETGLHYNYMRDYNPVIGRYIETDPIGQRGGINPYRYVGNPLNLVDPLGLFGTSNFVNHYFNGNGAPIDLGAVGLLNSFMNASSVQSAVNSFVYPILIAVKQQVSTLCDKCDKGTKSTSFSVNNNTTTDVTGVSGLFAVGDSSFFRSAQCNLTANCGTKKYSYSCNMSFSIKDKFEEPLDIPGVEIPGGTVYSITASWSQSLTGSGGW